MINFDNYKPEILSEKLYSKSSTILFKHKKLSKTDRFRKMMICSSRCRYFERSFLTSSSSRR